MKLLRHSVLLANFSLLLGGGWLLSLKAPDIHEPISQYTVYGQTRWLFALMLTLAAVFLVLFGLTLKNTWRQAPRNLLLSGLFFVLAAWIPYGLGQTEYWLHNVSFYLATFFLALTLWRCSLNLYGNVSHVFLLTIVAASGAAGAAVLAKQWSFTVELILVASAMLWLLALAYLPPLKQRVSAHPSSQSILNR